MLLQPIYKILQRNCLGSKHSISWWNRSLYGLHHRY